MSEPAWAIATLFPDQGAWTEEAYFRLDPGARRVELVDGRVEVLPVPTDHHQRVAAFLFLLLAACAQKTGGRARFAGTRVRLRAGRYREPDLVYLAPEHAARRHEEYWDGADLIVEIVSPSAEDRARDHVTKRREYAEGEVPEYWLVDLEEEAITVLRLEGARYVEHGVFGRGSVATSVRLPELAVDVSAALDAD